MRIVHLADYAAPYGGSYIARLCRALEAAQAKGWRSEVVLPVAAKGRSWIADIESRQVPVRFAPLGNRWRLAWWVAGLVRETEEDTLLHSHFFTFDIPALVAARCRKRTLVFWNVHNTLYDEPKIKARNTLTFGLLGRFVDGILCVAPDVVDSVRSRRSPAGRTHLLMNGIDSQRFPLVDPEEREAARTALGVPLDVQVLLHFGWDWHRKGGDLFLKAVRHLRNGGAMNLVALTVGSGVPARSAADELGLGDAVRVLEPFSDVRPLLAAADVVVSSSRGEGMPLAVVEALSRGVAVVATDLVGQAVIGRGLSAFRLTGFDPREIADAVGSLLARDAATVACDAEAAHRHIRLTRDLAPWAERLIGLYEQAIAAAMPGPRDPRSPERLRFHYDVERQLAGRLKNASKTDRARLYPIIYDELFKTVVDHPQLTRKAAPVGHTAALKSQVRLLERFLHPGSTFLEIGPGDCRLSRALADRAGKVYAVDVSDEITRGQILPSNVSLLLTDGTDIPLPPGSVDVAYSNQLMEHLHPDDAEEQITNVFKALAPGGVYICATPNRLSGPHDISEHFDEVASGLHLKEYTTYELRRLFLSAGFQRVASVVKVKRVVVVLPSAVQTSLERCLGWLPHRTARRLLRRTPVGKLLGTVVATRA